MVARSSYFFMNNSTNIKDSLVKVLNDLLLCYFFFSFHIVNKCRTQSTEKFCWSWYQERMGLIYTIWRPFSFQNMKLVQKKKCIQGCSRGEGYHFFAATTFLAKIKQNWILSMEAKNLQFTNRFKPKGYALNFFLH